MSDLLPASLFTKILCLERNRAERSGRRLVLMTIEAPTLLKNGARSGAAEKIHEALARSIRDTDIKGWHREGISIGVIFTEIPLTETSVVKILSRKVKAALHSVFDAQQFSRLTLSFHVFPEPQEHDETDDGPGSENFESMYPDLMREIKSKRIPLLVKRLLDVLGSLLAILVLGPLMILIAIAVKLSSPGPVLFQQLRLGQYGKSFTFLKFRSMYVNTDHAIHEAYIKSYISDKTDSSSNGEGKKVYKLQADPRVTPTGRFLRRTSLDELPQFFNVLIGQMSLVGPRPPIRYEFASYRTWHRRRLLAVKPGITGFWQVEGRSRVKFDEMVRMDLEYARRWSIWLDLKILLLTPRAVMSGNGAC